MDRALLQRRVASCSAVFAILGILFGIQRISQLAAIGSLADWWDGALLGNAIGSGTMVLLFALTWRGRRGARFVRVAEVLGFSVSFVGYVLAVGEMPQVFRPNLVMLLMVMVTLLVRSIWVPSTWRTTLVVSLLVGGPLLVSTWGHYAEIDPAVLAAFQGHDNFFEVTPENIRIDNLVLTVMWFSFTAFVASAASGVIYGLRREVRRARQLGQYVLEEKLGEGGMGVVYRARHAMLRRPTAIKLIRRDRFGEEALAQFEREVQLTARLTHPNTVTIYDYGRTPDGVFYYAMEYLDGATLEEIVPVVGRQPPERVVHVLIQVAGALAEAHGVGLIHRDIKPANIMLCQQGGVPDVAKVLDFGLVKEVGEDVGPGLTQAGVIKGTPYYMAPEAIVSPGSVDARSDLYALGAVGYFLLTGQPVFTGENAMQLCMHHVQTPPEPPSDRLGAPVPRSLEALLLDCLAKDPAARPQSAADLAARLRSCDDVGPWEGSWWWAEYGEALRARRQADQTPPDGLTVDIGLAGRIRSWSPRGSAG